MFGLGGRVSGPKVWSLDPRPSSNSSTWARLEKFALAGWPVAWTAAVALEIVQVRRSMDHSLASPVREYEWSLPEYWTLHPSFCMNGWMWLCAKTFFVFQRKNKCYLKARPFTCVWKSEWCKCTLLLFAPKWKFHGQKSLMNPKASPTSWRAILSTFRISSLSHSLDERILKSPSGE